MQPSWVTDEEFGMGYLDIKPPAASKSLPSNLAAAQNSSAVNVSQGESTGGRTVAAVTQHGESGNSAREHISRGKPADGRLDRGDSVSHLKSDPGHQKVKGGSLVNGSDVQLSVSSAGIGGTSRSAENQKQMDESANKIMDESTGRAASKNSMESEVFYELCSLCMRVIIVIDFTLFWCHHLLLDYGN